MTATEPQTKEQSREQTPEPVFGCKFEGCAEQVSFPADMIVFAGGGPLDYSWGYYCENCAEQESMKTEGTLKDFLQVRRIDRAD